MIYGHLKNNARQKSYILLRFTVYQKTSQNPIRATPTLKATGSTPAGCTSEKALRFLKKSQGFRYIQYQFKGLWCTIPFAYFFKQQRKRDPARNRARMVARDQQNPLSRLGQCRKTSGINRRRNCSANNFRLFARFRHRFRHQNAGQTMILNMENLPASSVGNLYTPQNLPPFQAKIRHCKGLTVVRNYKSCVWGRERCDREGHAVFLRPRVDSAIMGSASTGISTSSTKLKMISTFCRRLPPDLSGA